jgi:hypothetical protein
MSKTLSTFVSINSRFIRSVRLDADYGRRDILESFILQPSATAALELLARQINDTQQRAFTWTGPYGTGKSSLALALCSLLHPDPKVRGLARSAVKIERGSMIAKAFDAGPNGDWLVLPLVGRRAPITEELAKAINRLPRKGRKEYRRSPADLIHGLVELAEAPSNRGVLLVIDELGKFLEHSAHFGDDIYFFQELAEAAARAKGKLVIVGILHQSFDQYASRLSREQRDEWSKVQGRFLDISLTANSDEQIELIGKAIASGAIKHPETASNAKIVARSIQQRRSTVVAHLESKLDACWPLHPVTAALLGPSSKRKFGQNERSIFGFLNSVEPSGFREFLESTPFGKHILYSPARFWDYLRVNFEPAISASSDGHRWASAMEAVERAEAKGRLTHIQIVKTIAVIELFRNGSGLAPDAQVISSCFPELKVAEVDEALHELASWSIIIYRKHLSAWGIYAGSDFDIDAAVARARVEANTQDVYALTKAIELSPVLAKRVYHQTGAMHFLTRNILAIEELEAYSSKFRLQPGSCGEFVLALPDKEHTIARSVRHAERISAEPRNGELLIGIPDRGSHILELAEELCALNNVYASSTELDSDRIAAREISARMESLRAEIDDLLREAFLSAHWFWQGKSVSGPRGQALSMIASHVVGDVYGKAPILLSELINRESPSSNSVKARRDLMYRMLSNGGEEKLGYSGFSADAGLYYTILQSTTVHRVQDGVPGFYPPLRTKRGAELCPLWNATNQLAAKPGASISLAELYRTWSDPPYGIKSGVSPILALAFFLANQSSLALYHAGTFMPEMDTLQIDEWLQDPSKIEWRFVGPDATKRTLLDSIGRNASRMVGRTIPPEPLDVSRALVSLVLGLPGWTKRTNTVSAKARMVRQILLQASDPHRVLFTDLDGALNHDKRKSDYSASLENCLGELYDSYPKMLRRVETLLLQTLGHDDSVSELNERARTVVGITGDFRLEAFATRLLHYRSWEQDLEPLVSLAVSKPARDWTDQDIEAAIMQLGAWSMSFRQVEALAPIQNRAATRHALAVVFGPADGSKTVSRVIEISMHERKNVTAIARQILATRKVGNTTKQILLAALAEAGATLVTELDQEARIGH